VIWQPQSTHLAQLLWYLQPSRTILGSLGYTLLSHTGHLPPVGEPWENAERRSFTLPEEPVELTDEMLVLLSSLGRGGGGDDLPTPPNAAARSAIEVALERVTGGVDSDSFLSEVWSVGVTSALSDSAPNLNTVSWSLTWTRVVRAVEFSPLSILSVASESDRESFCRPLDALLSLESVEPVLCLNLSPPTYALSLWNLARLCVLQSSSVPTFVKFDSVIWQPQSTHLAQPLWYFNFYERGSTSSQWWWKITHAKLKNI